MYLDAVPQTGSRDRYLQTYVTPPGHDRYLEACGGLAALRERLGTRP
jgi:hypothetical protein